MSIDYDSYLDDELVNAPRTLTASLFHYTNSDVAIFNILAGGTLRLSPFESTNDLWESRPLYPGLSVHADDEASLGTGLEPWNEIDRNIRLHSKVVCLTRDWDLPDRVLDPDALRGWGHLSLWAHYGGGHTGVCLRFDRDRLMQAFESAISEGNYGLHGPVRYRGVSGGLGAAGIDIGQLREFGVDAVAALFAQKNQDSIFLTKHSDWATEEEYRFVLMDHSVLPAYLDIRHALTGVVLGEAFSQARMPALVAALEDFHDLEVLQLRFHNRRLACLPFDAGATVRRESEGKTNWPLPARQGSLEKRLAGLREAEDGARGARERGEQLCESLVQEVGRGVTQVADNVSQWPNIEVETMSRIEAVPVAQRSRKPGVPGERIHYERGCMCVVENLPKFTCTLVSAVAIQLLDEDLLRVHATVAIENWHPDGNQRDDLWRTSCEIALGDAPGIIASTMRQLLHETCAAQATFDATRKAEGREDT